MIKNHNILTIVIDPVMVKMVQDFANVQPCTHECQSFYIFQCQESKSPVALALTVSPTQLPLNQTFTCHFSQPCLLSLKQTPCFLQATFISPVVNTWISEAVTVPLEIVFHSLSNHFNSLLSISVIPIRYFSVKQNFL